MAYLIYQNKIIGKVPQEDFELGIDDNIKHLKKQLSDEKNIKESEISVRYFIVKA